MTATRTDPDVTVTVGSADGGPEEDRTVPGLILARARRRPRAVAVEAVDGRLTYGSLVDRAGAVARHLRALGISGGDVVAVDVERTIDLVPALLGVQLSGAAYLPLDPGHPRERVESILADTRTAVLLTDDAHRSPPGAGRTVPMSQIHPAEGTDGLGASPDAAAYVIHTSGSTGRPKGVMVGHRALTNLILSLRDLFGLPEDCVLPAVTTVSFDIAGLELFLPLTGGGTVVLGEPADARDPHRLTALVERAGASVLQATPTSWRLLLAAGWQPPPGFTVLCGGERLPSDVADDLLTDATVLWDLYGPTETTIWSAVTRYERGTTPRFHPVRGTSLVVLDGALDPVPDGSPGELYIGGPGLAEGYLGRPGATAGRFIAHPWSHGARLYRTGDLARRLPDGRTEILGRTDDQVKIRGFRVEPGEIEAALVRHPGVASAAVAAEQTDHGARLVAHVCASDPADHPDEGTLRRHLGQRLPEYMVPAEFRAVERLPTTPNGKLDRAALAAPDGRRSGAPVAAPRSPASAPPAADDKGSPGPGSEVVVARVLAEALDRDHVGVHDDFFSLGGDSLRAVQAILRLNAELGTELPVNTLFEMRTGYGLARLVDGDIVPEPTLEALPKAQPHQLSAAQWRLLLHQTHAPESVLHNRALALRVPDDVDVDAVRDAVDGLVARHGTLRTRYVVDAAGLPRPVLEEPGRTPVTLVDADPAATLADELSRPFDLAGSVPVRARVVRGPDGGSYVVLTVHEIAADHRSRALLVRQLRAAFRGHPVPDPPFDYVDYAAWQRELAGGPNTQRHLDYWRATLAGLDPADLRTDRPRPSRRVRSAGAVRFSLPREVVAGTHDLAADHDAPLAVGLLAGLVAVLDRYTTGSDVTVGVHTDGAEHPDLEQMVGAFESTVPLRVRTADADAPGQLLGRVREAAISALGHASPPLEDVVSATVGCVAPSAPGRNPLFDVSFALRAPTGLSDLDVPPCAEAAVDLHCELTELPDGGVDGHFHYAKALFDETTVRGMADEMVRHLTRVAAEHRPPPAPFDPTRRSS